MECAKNIVSVCLELTDFCKVGCPYCLLEEKVAQTSREKIIEIIEILVKNGVQRFSLGGGEPLEVPYIYEIGKIIRKHERRALLRTSACSLIDCQNAKQAFDIVDVSIDSYKLTTLKKCKPNIDGMMILKNVIRLSEEKVPLRCNILVTSYNLDDIVSTVRWLNSKGVLNVRIQKLVRRGKAKINFSALDVPDEVFKKIMVECTDVGIKLGMRITELKTVNSKTLCIVKPDGGVYIGTPTGIIRLGSVYSTQTLITASTLIRDNQEKYYIKEGKVGL